MSDICTAGMTICNDGKISRASLGMSSSSVICYPCMFIVICGKCKFPPEEAQESALRTEMYSSQLPSPNHYLLVSMVQRKCNSSFKVSTC